MSAVRIIPTEKDRLSDLFYRQLPMVSRESATISHAFCKKKPNEVHTGDAPSAKFS